MHHEYKVKDPASDKLTDGDKSKIAKAVSGFSNAGGGVVIWGLANNSLKPTPLHKAEQFCETLLKFSSTCTMPQVRGIDACVVIVDSEGAGFVILLVPESEFPPHQVITQQSDIQHRYYQRTGEGFHPVGHAQLEDMFGRRPRPKLRLEFKHVTPLRNENGWRASFEIHNVGRGSAKNTYLCISLREPDHGVQEYYQTQDAVKLTDTFRLYRSRSSIFGSDQFIAHWIAPPHVAIHSGMRMHVMGMRLWVLSNGNTNLTPESFEYYLCCDNAQPVHGAISVDPTKQVHDGW